jgi:hypothetical protein
MWNALPARLRRTAILVILGSAGSCPGAAAADWLVDLDAGMLHDSNLSHAYERADVVSDSAMSVAMSAARAISIDDRNSLTLAAKLGTTAYQRYHGMSSTALGVSLAYRRKFGLGLYAPSITLVGSAAREAYGQSARDGQRLELTAALNKRLSERLELSGGGRIERFNSRYALALSPERSGNPFDVRGRNLFARADYAWSSRWLGYAGLNLRRGEVVASIREDDEVFDASSAARRDPAFGPDYVAYRLSGETRSANVGISLEISPRGSMNFGIARDLTRISSELKYRRTLANAAFLLSF